MSSAKPRQREKEQTAEAAAPDVSTLGPGRFYNRELSWLQFNRRVLEEARNTRHPLLERLRFLSISASNLDEFYMVRAAGLYGQVSAGVVQPSQDGLTPAQQLAEITRFAGALASDQQACWSALKAEMATVGIHIVEPKDLQPPDRDWLERQFLAHHLPILTPIAVDPAHPFPFIQNTGLTVGCCQSRVSSRALCAYRNLPPGWRAMSPHRTASSASNPRSPCSWRAYSRASWRAAKAPSGSYATATSRSRRKPRTWWHSTKRR
jgi:polyphosphate kinase